MNAAIFLWSLIPGAVSIPLATSTAYGCTCRMASATFSWVSPPARMTGNADRCTTLWACERLKFFPLPWLSSTMIASQSVGIGSFRPMTRITFAAGFSRNTNGCDIWIASMCRASIFSRSSGDVVWLTATVVVNGPTASKISRARSGVTDRFEGGENTTTPIASAPHASAYRASSGFVIPQHFMRIRTPRVSSPGVRAS
jgi:hypothetical protein